VVQRAGALGGEILKERATERDIDELDPPAYTEDGDLHLSGAGE
jgi:hypothetical protein